MVLQVVSIFDYRQDPDRPSVRDALVNLKHVRAALPGNKEGGFPTTRLIFNENESMVILGTVYDFLEGTTVATPMDEEEEDNADTGRSAGSAVPLSPN